MATFNIICPHCGGTLEVQDEWAGAESTCPLCRKTFVVPRRENLPQVNEPPQENEPPAKTEPVPEEKTPEEKAAEEKKPAGEEKKPAREEKKPAGESKKRGKAKPAEKKESDDGPIGAGGFLIWGLIVIGGPILLSCVISWPRTIFWLGLPWGLIVFGMAIEKKESIGTKFLGWIMLFVLIAWGVWAHTDAVEQLELEKTIAVECEILQDNGKAKATECEVRLYPRSVEAESFFREALFVQRTLSGDAVKASFEVQKKRFELEKVLLRLKEIKGEGNILKDIAPGEYTLMVTCKNPAREFLWVTNVTKKADRTEIKLPCDENCLIIARDLPKSAEKNTGGEVTAEEVKAEKVTAEELKAFRRDAARGNAEAQCNLGVCYMDGNGVAKNMTEAVKWFRKASEQGLAKAQHNLGVCYDEGLGVAKNMTEAVKWYRKASDQGLADAQCNLGVCYLEGEGVAKNMAEAVKWFRKAADQGLDEAQCNIGVCYANGWGVEENESEALIWFRKAARQGHKRAQETLRNAGKTW